MVLTGKRDTATKVPSRVASTWDFQNRMIRTYHPYANIQLVARKRKEKLRKGEIVVKICPWCKEQNENDACYCLNCGHKFEQKDSEGSPPSQQVANTQADHLSMKQPPSKGGRIHAALAQNFKSKKFVIRFVAVLAAVVAIIVICVAVLYKPNPVSVKLIGEDGTVDIKEKISLQVEATPKRYSDTTFQCNSSKPGVVSLSFDAEAGNLTVVPQSEGTTEIKIDYVNKDGHHVETNTVTYQVIDKEKRTQEAAKVDEEISAIGEVTLDNVDAVINAQKNYESLSDFSKNLVKNKDTLDAAALKLQEVTQNAADPVIKAIDAIGTVDKNSGEKIKAARTAYDALPMIAKDCVTNTDKLTSAEASLQKIQEEERKKAEEEKKKAEEAKKISDFKASCGTYSYKEIARNPDGYKGKPAKFTGEVIQTIDDFGGIALRVNVTKGEYGFWSDTIYVTFANQDSSSRILEDDIVTMYGTLEGLETYTSTLGSSITIPAFDAQYIDIQ